MQMLREKLSQYMLLVLLGASIFIWYAVASEDRSGKLTVAFLDIGQGDAIFIESPSGNQMMIDGGPSASVLRELGKVLPFYDRTLDLLMVSNPDKDHFAGFLDILRSFKVLSVVEPGTTGASAEYKVLEEEIAEEGAQKLIAMRGQVIDLGGGARMEILFPDRDASGMGTNDGSIIAKLTYGTTSFLLTGDTTKGIEQYLSALDKEALDVDVLKIGHHGSDTSTSEALLGFASPAYAVISAGKGNRYGHPHAEVLARLQQFEIPVLGTYERGTIVFISDGETLVLKK